MYTDNNFPDYQLPLGVMLIKENQCLRCQTTKVYGKNVKFNVRERLGRKIKKKQEVMSLLLSAVKVGRDRNSRLNFVLKYNCLQISFMHK